MSVWRAFCECVHLLALAIWLGVVLATGAAAALIFPTMKQLQPRLPGFAAYTGEHWPIAGGKIANTLFFLADIVQFFCAITSVVSLLLLAIVWKLPRTRPATLLRGFALGIALASVGGGLIVLAPAMNAALQAYWKAAEAGNLDEAALHKQAFDENHPLASSLLMLTAASVFIALVAGIWSAVRPTHGEVSMARLRGAGSAYEVPKLAQGR
jgi:hypothetical protein